MKKTLFCIVVVMLSGCSSAKAFKLPDLNLLKHEQTGDLQAVKTGDIAPIKGPIKAYARMDNQIGSRTINNKQVQAGRDSSQLNVNDSTLMERYITALQDGASQNVMLYRYIVGGLLVQIAALVTLLGWALKFLLKSGADDDRFKEKLLEGKK